MESLEGRNLMAGDLGQSCPALDVQPAMVAPSPVTTGASISAIQAAPLADAGVVVDVPSSIDATGTREVSGDLMRWLSALPAATKESPVTIRFAQNGVYWVDYTIILRKAGTGGISGVMWKELGNFSLDHYRFDLNGATIHQRTRVPWKHGGVVVDARKRWGDPILATQGATDVQIYGGTLRGSNPTAAYRPAYEEWTGIRITGNNTTRLVEDIVVRDVTIENVYGDYIYLASATTRGNILRNVQILDNTMRVAGRQGIVINGATDLTIRGNTFGETARFLFDSEPTASQGWRNVTIDNNRGTSGKLGFFQFAGAKAVVGEQLTISNNVLTGGHFRIRLGNAADTLRNGFTFTGNVAQAGGRPFGGATANFLIGVTRWRNVTITGNSEYFSLVNGQPIHSAVKLTGVQNATVANNTWIDAVDG